MYAGNNFKKKKIIKLIISCIVPIKRSIHIIIVLFLNKNIWVLIGSTSPRHF